MGKTWIVPSGEGQVMLVGKAAKENAKRWLLLKGWSQANHWWLPPSGLQYKAKLYRMREAVRTETTLRGMEEVDVYANPNAGKS